MPKYKQIMSAKENLIINTPAKINFSLLIQKRRSDGYHDLQLDFFPINLFDTIKFKINKREETTLSSNFPELNNEHNTILKAISVLKKNIGKKINLDITLLKKIPMGAGLGGGSSNAAGVLLALNFLYDLELSRTRLEAMAIEIGADVPFFLNPIPSYATGIGENLIPIASFDKFFLIIIYPNLHISTKEAYNNCFISGRKNLIQSYSLGSLSKLTLTNLNDFWGYLTRNYPVLEACVSALKDIGALSTGLSGSGSTVFGIFKNRQERDHAILNLNLSESFQIFGCETMDSFSYLPKS